MLETLLKNKEFNYKIQKMYKEKKKEILDIILFGSTTRGKERPNDIDILIIYKEKEDLETDYRIRKELEKDYPNIQIISKTWESLLSKNFPARESIFAEGVSLLRKEALAKSLGFKKNILFRYELKGWTQSKRMQFQYALYGRDKNSGIVKRLHLQKFGDTQFLCPVEKSEECKEFFSYWKINTEHFPILIPQRLKD